MSLSPDQRRVAHEMVNVFEYSSVSARYDACGDLGDGRGLTCGEIGFTTSSTEVRDVVAAYTERAPGSPLARHLPRLRDLADRGSASTSGLEGFAADWAHAAGDPRFRGVQDAVADRLTYDPAIAMARRLGIRTPLGVAILFDTAVQHGTSDDPDGLPALVARAGAQAHGTPAGGVAEKTWLLAFLDVRRADLRNPHDEDSQDVWAQSVDRVDALHGLVEGDEARLDAPVTLEVDGEDYELR
ncbi:chitosanase [Actinoplanes sp. NPDC051411]|uniref:chitosanase n=1 Tax=Actinoplanes sp. NPDC051411 TaxID=3155522 RepID=UPI0034130AE0